MSFSELLIFSLLFIEPIYCAKITSKRTQGTDITIAKRHYKVRRLISIVKPESEVPKSKVPKSRPKGLGLTLKSHGPPPTHHPPHNF